MMMSKLGLTRAYLVEAVASPIHEIVLLKLNILLLENFYGPLAPVYETSLGKDGGPM